MTDKTVAILQSNYIPWKGYFDLIRRVDEFILYDDAQYTRRDWRNRNRIKTPQGVVWLTIPVDVRGKYTQTIKATRIADSRWAEHHWKTLCHSYSRAPFFHEYEDLFRHLYLDSTVMNLSEVNYRFLMAICNTLGIETVITWSMDYKFRVGRKTESLVELCVQAGASRYISGPAAKNYLDENLFEEQGITVSWMEYSGYPEYPQMYPPFEHAVSVLDLLFNTGPNANAYLKNSLTGATSVMDAP